MYWDLGHDIVVRQMDAAWGKGFFTELSKELMSEFPEMKGFSKSNLYNVKRFYEFYTQDNTIFHQVGGKLETPNRPQVEDNLQINVNKNVIIRQQVADELQITKNENSINRPQLGDDFESLLIAQIPWRHHVEIFTKCKSVKEALFYVQKTIQNGWSRAVLLNFLEVDLYGSQGKSLNNFDRMLPAVQSDLAKEVLKDPYNFDFLLLSDDYKEKELEDALVSNITKLLLELGQGFAYIGRQYPIKIGNKDRYIDLLFTI